MKKITHIKLRLAVMAACLVATLISCERDLSDDAVIAPQGNTAAIFIDGFIGLGTNSLFSLCR